MSTAITGCGGALCGWPCLSLTTQPQIRPPTLASASILAGEDLDHARHLLGRRGVDALDLGVGVRRAQEVGVGRARERQIVDIAAGPGQEALVFRPKNAGADSGGGGHGYTPADFMAGAAARIAFTMLW